MTLRDINRALDRLGVEAFVPHTIRHAQEEHSVMNALRTLAASLGRWRLRWIANRRLRRLIRQEEMAAALLPRRMVVVANRRTVTFTRSGRFASRPGGFRRRRELERWRQPLTRE